MHCIPSGTYPSCYRHRSPTCDRKQMVSVKSFAVRAHTMWDDLRRTRRAISTAAPAHPHERANSDPAPPSN
eukprot:CAMPEP_0181178590 /NCGR_PEP_ID=MMETSP1096-20121128/5800_1 /TAXON_ID=156174 ORGANISM="Chrysochromulina ericina, Strain CCMP281" /NCGR_SAMPLE_ID=MMETSP1096 /ASSEMBLY_ACC=CAM_ASM_000453 /LENGTH=70 /DNA_ID=CAMNT_0023266867 /DNA_START=185 /DNA_END=394 /DNA_ORIENTATION=-